jgi:hypothetical protein
MAVEVLSGDRFDGVDFGTARGKGYIIGTSPVSELLLVDLESKKGPLAEMYGVKYFHHNQGDMSDEARMPDPNARLTRMTMLVSQGRWRQRVWLREKNRSIELLLKEPGDFIAWGPDLWHSWYAESASTMLTVSFQKKPSTSPALN